MMIVEFKNVKHSNPLGLVIMVFMPISLFFLSFTCLIKLIDYKIIALITGLVLSIICFLFFKKRIIKKSVFRLFTDKFEYEDKKIYFNAIKNYKIHWLKGAGLKIVLKSGETIRLSANNNFYSSRKFVEFCERLDPILLKFKNGVIVRKKSFLETKFGYYFFTITLLVITVLFIIELFR